MNKPILYVVDDDPAALGRVEHELNRYVADYEVMREASPLAALNQLQTLKADGRDVVLVFAGLWMNEICGVDLLRQVHDFLPQTKRVLMSSIGDKDARDEIVKAMTQGWADHYMWKPFTSPDEYFHRFVTERLDEWRRTTPPDSAMISIVGERWSARGYEMRDLLNRFNIPFRFYDLESEAGQALLQELECPEGPFPVVVLMDNRAMTNPTNEQIADSLGVNATVSTDTLDLVVIGAGPAGLSAAVYGASEGLKTLVIERQVIGGQAGMSSRIRNYLGFPNGITGAEMAKRAYTQAWLFGSKFYLMHDVVDIRVEGDQRVVVLADGQEIRARAVVLAMGAAYRRLKSAKLDSMIGAGVFYGTTMTEAQAMSGQDVFVAGAGNSAGQAVVHLSRYARSVTVLVRGSSLAARMSDYLVQEIEATPNIRVMLDTEIVDAVGEGRLSGLVLENVKTGERRTVDAAALFVQIGADPCTGWLPAEMLRDRHGYLLTGQDMAQDGILPLDWTPDRIPLHLETSMPGVFAAGDVRSRSMKRVAAAVGEGGTVISLVHEYLSTLPVLG